MFHIQPVSPVTICLVYMITVLKVMSIAELHTHAVQCCDVGYMTITSICCCLTPD
jgi:hypothetical protein